MAPFFIPFDGWSPGPSYFGEGWSTVNNLFPIFNAWAPARAFVADVNSVAFGPMTGAHAHLWPSGTGTASYVPDDPTLFTGSKTRLFTVAPSTGVLTDVSRAANYAAAGEPAGWRFATVGNDIWATNWLDPMQRRVANAGPFTDGCVGTFRPVARHLAVVREHLLAANLRNAGRFVDELVWSNADDATLFDPPTGTSTSIAGAKRLVSIPGQITALVGGQYGLAFKRTAVYYLEATGTTQGFRPDVLSPHVGTAYGSSVVNTRHGIFFLGPDGFYRIRGLSEPEKLSSPGVDSELLAGLFATQGMMTAELEDIQMFGFSVPGMPLIGWLYRLDWLLPSNNLMIVHNPVTGQWAQGTGTAFLNEEAELFTTVVLTRPFGTDLYNPLAALTWDTSVTRFAPWAASSVRQVVVRLRFRPSNLESAGHQQQSVLTGVLPVFSKVSVASAALTESITVRSLLDPHGDVWKTEGPRLASQRDSISGMFPFEITGRFFDVMISCAIEDFASFEGVYVDQRLLT